MISWFPKFLEMQVGLTRPFKDGLNEMFIQELKS